ncbi:MAG TPA: Yip1 family protein [Casimicrobiaceae bacterium]|nr:Yip1 family protein [Casimicrobiaceae bacterium]
MRIFEQVAMLLFRPREAWEAIAHDRIGIDALIRRYILPFSLLAPIATVIGMSTFDREWDPAAGYLVPPDAIYSAGSATLFGTIISIFTLAAIFKLIAPMYGSSRDYGAALRVATFGAIPLLLAGATLFFPAMVMVTVVALTYTLYQYWLGVGRVLNVSAGAQTEFIGISMTMLGGASTLAGAFLSSIGVF